MNKRTCSDLESGGDTSRENRDNSEAISGNSRGAKQEQTFHPELHQTVSEYHWIGSIISPSIDYSDFAY
jgi:hypothetical protein